MSNSCVSYQKHIHTDRQVCPRVGYKVTKCDSQQLISGRCILVRYISKVICAYFDSFRKMAEGWHQ